MSYGLEIRNSSGTVIVNEFSNLGSLVAHGVISADNAKYDSAAAANPNWVSNPLWNAPAWFAYGERTNITVSVPDYINDAQYHVIAVGPSSIFVSGTEVISTSTGSITIRRNDKFDSYFYIVRKG